MANFRHLRDKLYALCDRGYKARAKAGQAQREADMAQEAYYRGVVAAWEAATSMDDCKEVRYVASLMFHVPLELRPNVTDAHLAAFLDPPTPAEQKILDKMRDSNAPLHIHERPQE